jgi:hypothetical protein
MSAGDDLMDSSGDARIGVPPARCALLGQCIAITVKHDVSPFGEHPDAVNIFRIKRPERDPLSVGFSVSKSSLLKLNDSKQESFAVVSRNNFSVRMEPSESSGP